MRHALKYRNQGFFKMEIMGSKGELLQNFQVSSKSKWSNLVRTRPA